MYYFRIEKLRHSSRAAEVYLLYYTFVLKAATRRVGLRKCTSSTTFVMNVLQPRESSAMGPAKVNLFLAKVAVSGTRNFRQPSYYIYIYIYQHLTHEDKCGLIFCIPGVFVHVCVYSLSDFKKV